MIGSLVANSPMRSHRRASSHLQAISWAPSLMNTSRVQGMWNGIKGWLWCSMDLQATAGLPMPMASRIFTSQAVVNRTERFTQLRARSWQTSNNSPIYNSSRSMMSMAIPASHSAAVTRFPSASTPHLRRAPPQPLRQQIHQLKHLAQRTLRLLRLHLPSHRHLPPRVLLLRR